MEVTGEGEARIRVGVRMLESAGGEMGMLRLIMRRKSGWRGDRVFF